MDVQKLAARAARFEAEVPLSELPGLPDDLPRQDRSIHAAVVFGNEGRWSAADIALKGELALTCQRCLEPLVLPIDSRSRVVLVESEEQSREAPEEFETVLAPAGQTSIAALVAEELLLSLPIVPLHDAPCAPAATAAVAVEPEAATRRPFKDLRALLKGE
ncbi:MAG TPA: DUF177 domain-containing protein [Steroidobacteraceae bacterium]|nr:DUF177 domain-containing protein [Steroidobacteraceae bacterium]